MIIIGLTGSIGAGKSYVSRIFAELGYPVMSSDALVAEVLAHDHIVYNKISQKFPEVVRENQIDKAELRKIVFNNSHKLRVLEKIIYPSIALLRARKIREIMRARHKLVFIEIPLLFEKNMRKLCDYVITISASNWLREKRVWQRSGIDHTTFRRISAQQYSDYKKRNLADFVIYNDGGSHLKKDCLSILKELAQAIN